MERICSRCHAVLAPETNADWCPACGSALLERPELPQTPSEGLPRAVQDAGQVDHRGIVLPRRHPVGGVITPQ